MKYDKKQKEHILVFNQRVPAESIILEGIYEYGYYIDDKSIEYVMGIDCAEVHFPARLSGNRKKNELSGEEVHFKFTREYQDAARKIMLLHYMQFGHVIAVNQISLYDMSDDHEKTYVLYSKESSLPCPVDSMLKGELHLGDSWFQMNKAGRGKVSEDRRLKTAICHRIIHGTNTGQKEDPLTAMLYTYLVSCGRTYIYDRFLNLWTGINIYYTWRLAGYNRVIRETFSDRMIQLALADVEMRDKSPDVDSFRNWEKNRSLKAELRKRFLLPEKSDQSGIICVSEMDFGIHYDTNTGGHSESNRNQDVITFYEDQEIYNGLQEESRDRIAETYYGRIRSAISDREKDYIFTLIFPYFWRNSYFHGRFSLPIVGGQDVYEWKTLQVLCDYMDRFLNDNLPQVLCGTKNVKKEACYNIIEGYRIMEISQKDSRHMKTLFSFSCDETGEIRNEDLRRLVKGNKILSGLYEYYQRYDNKQYDHSADHTQI